MIDMIHTPNDFIRLNEHERITCSLSQTIPAMKGMRTFLCHFQHFPHHFATLSAIHPTKTELFAAVYYFSSHEVMDKPR